MEKLTTLKNYFSTVGLTGPVVEKITNDKRIPVKTDLIQQRMMDYQAILQVDQKTLNKLVAKYPVMLSYDTASNNPTAIKSKIKNLQNILQIDEATMLKTLVACPSLLGYDAVSNHAKAVKSKIKALQTLLGVDIAVVRQMIISFPVILSYAIVGDTATSISSKIRYLKTAFGVDDQTVAQMLVKTPSLLSFNMTEQGPTSLITKIQKMTTMITPEQLRACVIQYPTILTVPAQAFKIRYMLAENYAIMPTFLKKGFLTSQNKVWARACYLNHQQHDYSLTNVYTDETRFQQACGAKSDALMQRYPLNNAAVANIETSYRAKTGSNLTLDPQERAVLGLER